MDKFVKLCVSSRPTSINSKKYYNKEEVNELLDSKVDKVDGKDLSSNDFTNTYKDKIDNAISKTEAESKFLPKGNYATKSELPTKVSELENDKGYLTEHQSLVDYAKKNDVYTKAQSDAKYQPKGNYITNVKTINGNSIVGTGDIKIEGSDYDDTEIRLELAKKANKSEIPTDYVTLELASHYLTEEDLPEPYDDTEIRELIDEKLSAVDEVDELNIIAEMITLMDSNLCGFYGGNGAAGLQYYSELINSYFEASEGNAGLGVFSDDVSVNLNVDEEGIHISRLIDSEGNIEDYNLFTELAKIGDIKTILLEING